MRKQARSERGAEHRLVERTIETLVSQRHHHSEVPDLNRSAPSDTFSCVSIREDEPSSTKPASIKLQPLNSGITWRESNEPVVNKTMVTLRDLSETACQEGEQTPTFNATPRSAAGALSKEANSFIQEAAIPLEDSMIDLNKHEIHSFAEQLQAELTASLADALYLNEADIDADKPFIDLGLDSIIGVEWMRSVNHHYRTAVPATKVYDYPNIRELAAYFASQLLQMDAHRRSRHDIEEMPAVTEPKMSADLSYSTISHKSTSSSVQRPAVLEQLAASLADALYLSTEHLDTEAKFIDLGLDSIVGIEWLRAINRAYGMDITIAKLYDHPTLSELAKYLESQLGQSALVLSDHALSAVNHKESSDSNQSTLDDILQQVQAGRLDIQQAEQLLIALGGI
ncbi:acyl carrier protein [Paenibacillus sp. 1001270B_150601_E10]|uniref:acyl carrier protein n=1 Tax=Paenibacillus sp. 1001270B_150601_E10 TaxID=2787079 RepID=UPI002B4C1346|nr:acyl carrier protein [Paenibacillus sp. 1001270B_150601_E10]